MVSQAELAALEIQHVKAAIIAEQDERWTDAVREWREAMSMLSKRASKGTRYEKEAAAIRYKEYKRHLKNAADHVYRVFFKHIETKSLVKKGLKISAVLAAIYFLWI